MMAHGGKATFLGSEFIVSSIRLAWYMDGGQIGGSEHHPDRPNHGLVYFAAGCTDYFFSDGTSLTASEGDFLFLPYGSDYRYVTKAPGKVYAVNFLCTENRRGIPPVVFHLSPDSAAEILPLFRKIESVWRLQQTDVQDACRAVVYELLYRIRREMRTTSGGGLYTIPRYLSAEQRKLLEPALGCIHEHLTDDGALSSPSLADVCGISETYLRRLFKAAFDRSPVQYIHEQRCRYAHRLLTEGDLSVQAACFAAGFHSLGYFSRVYRQVFGESPSDTRKHRETIPEKEDQSCFPE